MGLKKTAADTDVVRLAAALHRVGGKAGDAVANAVIAPARRQINVSCTRCTNGTCNH